MCFIVKFHCRQEIIEMLLTEKDSQIALMEMAGARTQSQIERWNRLHSDRCRINKRLKIEVFLVHRIQRIREFIQFY